jgi:activator of HSP90 ATPase
VNNSPFASDCNISRRRWLLHSSLAAGALALQSAARSLPSPTEEISRTDEAIHQELSFNAKPERIYSALIDAASFQKIEALSDARQSLDITGHPAKISRDPGGPFSLFADYIVGRQIELIPNQRIVQAWRVASWDPGIYSIARFDLTAQREGTKLVFDHKGFPAGTAEHLASGWYAHYWDPLRKFLG